ncbi:MAG: hypothetical protein GX442_19780 [Candidatus Riflebacteria bacterium]|nr:hypothetical protein [Candidatus Riflebacteria bacterium]
MTMERNGRRFAAGLAMLVLLLGLPAALEAGSARIFPSYCGLIPVKGFDKSRPRRQTRDFTAWGDQSEVHVSNWDNQHVTFRLDKWGRPVSYHGGIVFLMYEFCGDEGTYLDRFGNGRLAPILKRLSYFDAQGNPIGDAEFDDVSRFEFEIRDREKFQETMTRIDGQDGNLDTEDEAEGNILRKVFDSRGRVIRSGPISTSDFWEYQHFGGKP